MLKFDSSKVNIWFTADTHYGQTNMVRALSTWKDKENTTRDFKTVSEMSTHIVNQINKYVSPDDILFHLGDWSFGGIPNIWEFRSRIMCENIYLMPGNHDTHITNDIILPNCYSNDFDVIVLGSNPNRYGDWKDGLYDVNAKKLFTEVSNYMEIQVNGKDICMMHYPIESWNRHFIHLHGHCHSRLPLKEHRLDVGMDNAFKLFKEYKPFSLGDIFKHTR